MRWLVPLLVMALGAAAILLGGADDSPGLQGIGAVLVAGGTILCVRAGRRGGRRRSRMHV